MSKLHSKIIINNKVELRNRFVMAPMTTWSGNPDGTVSNEELEYYHKRSKEVGMTITATTYTLDSGKGFKGQFFAGDDSKLDSLTSLADTIKSAGALAVLQVFHAGNKATPEIIPEGVALSASAVVLNRDDSSIPRAMTLEEIDELIQSFYDVVGRAIKAGFDGIEIHGANTYLIQQFFSPRSNIREDKWGGSLEKRASLPLAIIDECVKARKDANREEFLLGYRFSPEENYDVGITLDDTDYLTNLLSESELDFLDISLGKYDQSSMRDELDNEPILSRVHKVINNRKQLIGVGSIYDLDEANNASDLGCELVALGRSIIIEPEIVSGMELGRVYNKLYTKEHKEKYTVPANLDVAINSNYGWFPMDES